MKEIEDFYDFQYDEWSRLDRHKIEFDITKKYLDAYISESGLSIIDIGGGPGRYAFYLAQKGHCVTLVDLSSKNITVAMEKSLELGLPLAECVQGNALHLEMFQQVYDVVMLMGPLYHLTRLEERQNAVQQAYRLLKPGGLFIASFISAYAPMQSVLSDPLSIENPSDLLRYLKDGVNPKDAGFTVAYFSGVREARQLMAEVGLKELAFAGVENILGCKEREITALEQEKYDVWVQVAYELSQDESVFGVSQHFLYMGRK